MLFFLLASGGQGALFEKTAPWTPTKTFISDILGALFISLAKSLPSS